MSDKAAATQAITAYLGWNNAERDDSSLRLYATDRGESPRWSKADRGGRVVEYACAGRGNEGDRYLVVRIGDRFVTRGQVEVLAKLVEAFIDDQMADPS